MEEEMSKRQTAILDYVRAYVGDHGYPPSVRDIQVGLGISSTSVVDYNLRRLEWKKRLRRTPGIARGIVLIDQD